jgi:hypothetical protein
VLSRVVDGGESLCLGAFHLVERALDEPEACRGVEIVYGFL